MVARVRFDRRCLMYKQPKRQPPQAAYDTSRLVYDEDTRHAYLLSLSERISSMPTSFDPNARLKDVLRCVNDATTETVGMATSHTHRRYTQDPLVAKLSAQQRALRLHIEATAETEPIGGEKGAVSSDRSTNDFET